LRLQGLRDDLVALRSAVGARHVLDGTVRADGDQIEIAARLRVLASGAVLREESCRGARADLFALRQRLARATIEALNVRLSPTEDLDLASQPLTDMIAYECYLRARQCVLRYDPSNWNAHWRSSAKDWSWQARTRLLSLTCISL